MAQIKVEHLHKRFDDFIAVKDSTFVINDGEFFVLLGPSGCGKTTTLRMIAGLELPTSGEIFLGDDEVTYARASQRDIAFMFQMFALYPYMNVHNNIAFPLKCEGKSRTEIKQQVHKIAKILRIEHLLNSPVSGLSGGDKQRVALGRAIVRTPKAFLMDEPLGALDTEFRELMCTELRELHNQLKATTVYVTHDQLEAMSMADRIMVMNHGIIEQVGTPQEIYNRPQSMYVANFIGDPSMNFVKFHGKLEPQQTSIDLQGETVAIPRMREGQGNSSYVLGVRPEQVLLTDDSRFRGKILSTEYFGTNQVVTIHTDLGKVKATLPSSQKYQTDQNIGLKMNSSHLVIFEGNGGKTLHSDFMAGG